MSAYILIYTHIYFFIRIYVLIYTNIINIIRVFWERAPRTLHSAQSALCACRSVQQSGNDPLTGGVAGRHSPRGSVRGLN